MPEDVEAIAGWLLNESFESAAGRIASVQREKGIALADLLSPLASLVVSLELANEIKTTLLSELSNIEYVRRAARAAPTAAGGVV